MPRENTVGVVHWEALQTGFEAAVDAAVERRVGGLREEFA